MANKYSKSQKHLDWLKHQKGINILASSSPKAQNGGGSSDEESEGERAPAGGVR